jgi:hypothetical protein
MSSDYNYYLNQIKKDKNELGLQLCPKPLQEDPVFIQKALPYIHYNTISETLKDHEGLIKRAFILNFHNLEFFPKHIKENKEWAKYFVSQNGLSLKYLTKFQDDKEVCQKAINQTLLALPYIKHSLKDDNDLITRAIWEDAHIYLSLSLEKQKEHSFIEQVLFKDATLYFQFPSIIQKDEAVTLQALKAMKAKVHLNKLISYWDETHFNNKNIVLASIEKIEGFLAYVGDDIKKDEDVINKALSHNPMNLAFLSHDKQDNDTLVKFCVQSHGMSLQFASERLKADKKIVSIALNSSPGAMAYACHTLKNDLAFMQPLLEQKTYYYQYLSHELKENRALFEQIFQKDKEIFPYADIHFRSEAKYAKEAIYKNASLFEHVGDNLKNDMIFMTEFLDKKATFYQYLSYELKQDLALFEKYFKKDKTIFICSSEQIKNNPYYAYQALKTNTKFFDYLGSHLKKQMNQKKYDNTTLALLEKLQLESILEPHASKTKKVKI